MRKLILSVLVGTLVAACATPARANIYGFTGVTYNNQTNTTTGISQLFVDVTSAGPNQVNFRFYNTGPLPSSITDVYFQDGPLLGISSISNMSGVSFAQYASPGNLPGGNMLSPAFVTTQGFSADSNAPVQPNGVNPGE